MRFIHLADLHLGKQMFGINLIKDQEYALRAVLDEVREIRPDAAFLAGDLYDRLVPSEEAVLLFDAFLTALTTMVPSVCIVGGNHDAQGRLSFASAILSEKGLYISSKYQGKMQKITLQDTHGPVDIWLLPYLRPREVAVFFPDQRVESVDDAVRAAIEQETIDPLRRHVLVTHQFVAAVGETPLESESERNPVGGLHVVRAERFNRFHYVALGHLHRPQTVGRETVRYAGSLLKYSFSEARHEKSFVSGEMDGMGRVVLQSHPIPALHGVREIKGCLTALLDPVNVQCGNVQDYLRVTLTDDPPPMAPMERLSAVFPHVLRVDFQERFMEADASRPVKMEEKSAYALFGDFYESMTGRSMSDRMAAYAVSVMNELLKEGE